jgi:DNA-binding MarR family transcriptional regulator
VANAEGLADRLHSTAIHLLRRLRRTDPQTGVTAAQLSALSVLMGGPLTLSRLAAAEQVQLPTISRLVSSMAEAGLVTRTRDAADARVVWVSQTAHGAHVLNRGRQLRITALQQHLETLSDAERRTLQEALAILDEVLARL